MSFQNCLSIYVSNLLADDLEAWQQLFPSTWHQRQAGLNEYVIAIASCKELVEKETSALELERDRQTRVEQTAHFNELLEQGKQARLQAEDNFRKLDVEERLRRKTHLLNWLSAPDTAVDQEHGRTLREQYPNSGQWLLDDPTFQAWLEPAAVTNTSLWITGIPGAGSSEVFLS